MRSASASNMAIATTTTVTVRQIARTLHRAVVFGALDPARPRPIGSAAAELLTAPALERGLLLEGRLELRDALLHLHKMEPRRAAGTVAKDLAKLTLRS